MFPFRPLRRSAAAGKSLQILVLAGCGFIPFSPVVEDNADLIELNYFYNECGKLSFAQVIFWDWWPDEGALHVAAWRMYKSESQFPQKDRRGGFVTRWFDGAVLRQVRSPHRRITWSQYDPEIEDRRRLPQEKRRGLTPAP